MKNKRIQELVSQLNQNKIEQILVTDPTSIYYLIQERFECSERCLALLVRSNGDVSLLLNELFNVKNYGISLILYNDSKDPIEILAKQIDLSKTLGIDGNWPSRFLIPLLKKINSSLIFDSSYLIDFMRCKKDSFEAANMRHSSLINDSVMTKVVKLISSEFTESDLVKKLPTLFETNGASKLSFNPIIAYGTNCANPHHEPTETKLQIGDSIIVDMGGIYNDYCSDMTRTFFYKSVSDEAKKIYEVVLRANLAAIKMVKPGITINKVDEAARSVIEEAGFGEYFTHRTGHGIGLCVHELPSVSSSDTTILKPGMCFSIEPGIYKQDVCGVRIEDIVMVTESGYELLNHYTKELTIIQ
ncbi:MAG: aminopeptidase P family protein [Fusobacteria bacterium]|nr:aminopeptidase P family protein [Fusobacteriota bacterium]